MNDAPDLPAPPLSNRSPAEFIDMSKSYGPDRLPDHFPDADLRVAWVYAGADFELAALAALVGEGLAAINHVDYPSNFGSVSRESRFQRVLNGTATEARFLATGPCVVTIDGEEVARFDRAPGARMTGVSIPSGAMELRITVTSDGSTPAAIAYPCGKNGESERWKYRNEDGAWLDAVARVAGIDPPHESGESTTPLSMIPVGAGLYALDASVLGRVFVESATRPRLGVGESLDEAYAAEDEREARCDVVEVGPGLWMSEHRLGFRYAVIHDADPTSVIVQANTRAARTRGAFLCNDVQLNRVWATSAYTLRLCMQVFLLDGVKRDRMPWMGDNALGVSGTAYAFGDGEPVRNTLTALGHPTHGYVNGIADYSLWWLVSQGSYQRFFADRAYLRREAHNIDAFLSRLAHDVTDDGIFRPSRAPDAFPHSGPGSVFLDWGATVQEGRDSTAVQMLWYWAVRSGARLLEDVRHPGFERWHHLAEQARTSIHRLGWDNTTSAWKQYLDPSSEPDTYANLFAVLSRISGSEVPQGVTERIRLEDVGTPFMRSFALRALSFSDPARAVAEIRTTWGGMLDAGATAFWEEFDADSDRPYEMYGRPYGKSLGHAWSAGPAALLPELVLGVQPLTDGWSTFAVEPRLGSLSWAASVTPVPAGSIAVFASHGEGVQVDVPEGCALVHDGRTYPGPCTFRSDPAG